MERDILNMLRKQPWLKPSNGFKFELIQVKEEGKDISPYVGRVEKILSMDESDNEMQKLAGEIYDEIQQQGMIEGYPYSEPSDLEGIKAARP